MSITVMVHTLEDLNALIFNSELKIEASEPVPHIPGAWRVTYNILSEYLSYEPKNTNVYVAAFTTCWARLKLWRELHKLGERVLYYDTDSIIDIDTEDKPSLELGPYLGDLTNELPEGQHIQEFVSTGPKSYIYTDNLGATTIKVKCLSKTLFNVGKVDLSAMVHCVQDASFRVSCENGTHNLQFQLNQWGHVKSHCQTKAFQMVYNKRFIDSDTKTTYPFGYQIE